MSNCRNGLYPVLQLKHVNIQAEEEDGENGKPENKVMITPYQFALCIVSKARYKTPEAQSAEEEKNRPAYEHHRDAIGRGVSMVVVRIADIENQEDNNKIDNVVEHKKAG